MRWIKLKIKMMSWLINKKEEYKEKVRKTEKRLNLLKLIDSKEKEGKQRYYRK